MGEEVLQFCRY